MQITTAHVRPRPLVLDNARQLAAYRAVLNEGMATATERAYRRDLRYFSAWYQKVYGKSPEMPIPAAVAIRFLLDHTQGTDPKTAAYLVDKGYRRHTGPLRWRTVQRYLTALSVAHIACGHPSPDHDAQFRLLMRRIKRNPNNPPKRKTRAITADILKKLLRTCDQSLYGVRDRAILLTGFCAGGRRRSEIAAIRVEDLERIKDGYLIRITP